MKKKRMAILALIMITSCDNQIKQNKDMQQQAGHVQSDSIDKSKNNDPVKFAGLHFASRMDTACGMLITSGAADTLVLDGKIYGFCSAGCKNEFANELVAQNKR